MIDKSPGDQPMKLFRAVYKGPQGKEENFDLYAASMAKATLSATELIPTDAALIRVFHNPDW